MLPDDGLEQWHSPVEHKIKVNTDAALFDNPNRYSIATIVRDHTGTLVQAKSTCLQGSVAPEFAEAVRVRESHSWVKNNKFADTIVETDCLQVVQLIPSPYSSYSYLGKVIKDCKDLLLGMKN